MPRSASVGYEDFKIAAEALRREVGRVTFAAIRMKLGGGSYDVLKRYMERYEMEAKDLAARDASKPVVEATLKAAIVQMTKLAQQTIAASRAIELRDAANEQLAAELQRARKDLIAATQRAEGAGIALEATRRQRDKLAAQLQRLERGVGKRKST